MRHTGNTTAIKNCLSSQMREALVSPISDKGSELSLLMRGVLIAGSPDSGTPNHPRGCREHRRSSTTALSWLGSSPRTRGALGPCARWTMPPWIIPADARSTDLGARYSRRIQDHPHGCGEHKGSSPTKKLDPGSSPRMRGANHLQDGDPPRTRIIPADAGSTSS